MRRKLTEAQRRVLQAHAAADEPREFWHIRYRNDIAITHTLHKRGYLVWEWRTSEDGGCMAGRTYVSAKGWAALGAAT